MKQIAINGALNFLKATHKMRCQQQPVSSMSLVLELSSRTYLLRANYFPPIILKEESEIALIQVNLWNSIENLTTENNNFYYKTADDKDDKIEISVGSYEISDLGKYLQ